MVKIVHVAGFGLQPKTNYQHAVCHKISNGFIRNNHVVCNFAHRDVARAASPFGSSRLGGIKAANRALQEYCYNIQPDVLLLGHADLFHPKTLASIRQSIPSIKIVQWSSDALFCQRNVSHLRSKFDVVDATLITTAGEPLKSLAKMTDSIVGFLPNPVDFSVESGKNHEKQLPYDLFYSCGDPAKLRYTCGEYWSPDKLIQKIEDNVPGTRLLLAGVRGHPKFIGSRYQESLESAAIGFNLSVRNDHPLYSSDRLAQMCGNGLAILIDRATGYDQLFSESEFAFFSTIDELIAQVRLLISDVPYRQMLAKAGRERYHSLFNEQIVAKYILEVALGTLNSSNYIWPTIINKRTMNSEMKAY